MLVYFWLLKCLHVVHRLHGLLGLLAVPVRVGQPAVRPGGRLGGDPAAVRAAARLREAQAEGPVRPGEDQPRGPAPGAHPG